MGLGWARGESVESARMRVGVCMACHVLVVIVSISAHHNRFCLLLCLYCPDFRPDSCTCTFLLHCPFFQKKQVRLVCEYCDRGSLREALDLGAFSRADGSINYPAVLDTALEIAAAVAHLHNRNVLHSDLKVGACLCGFFLQF